MVNENNTTNGVDPCFSFVMVVVPLSAVVSSIMITLLLFRFGSFRILFGLLCLFRFVSSSNDFIIIVWVKGDGASRFGD